MAMAAKQPAMVGTIKYTELKSAVHPNQNMAMAKAGPPNIAVRSLCSGWALIPFFSVLFWRRVSHRITKGPKAAPKIKPIKDSSPTPVFQPRFSSKTMAIMR